jgi:hypothetical protein
MLDLIFVPSLWLGISIVNRGAHTSLDKAGKFGLAAEQIFDPVREEGGCRGVNTARAP